jgi:hypothetical protein
VFVETASCCFEKANNNKVALNTSFWEKELFKTRSFAINKNIKTRLVELVDTTDSKSVPNGYRFKSDNE